MSLHIDQIRIDGGTQSRAAINEATVAEYAEAMADADIVFPPIIAYFDGRDYWLADGFHRLAAWRALGRTEIPAEVRQGDRRRAILHSVAANSTHGLRRTNEDKRRAVLTLLEDEEWGQWSNREIARRCAVSDHLVADLRAGLTAFSRSEDTGQRTYTTKYGTAAVMKTANIGAASKPDQEPQPQQSLAETAADASETAPEAETHQEPDPHAAERRALAKLTREALEDDVIGLRAQLADERAAHKATKAERDNLKARLREFETASDLGRALGNAQREAEAIRGRMREIEATAARDRGRANRLEAEIKRIRSEEIVL